MTTQPTLPLPRGLSWAPALPCMGPVYGLHFLNDGFQAAFLLLLTFLAADLGLNSLHIGVITSAHFSLGVLLAVPAGLLARRIGGERLLVAAMLIYAAALSLLPASASFLSTLAVFLLAGVGLGVFHPVAFALVARQSKQEQTSGSMALFTAVGDLGRLAISAATAALLAVVGWPIVSSFWGLLTLIAGAWLWKTSCGAAPVATSMDENTKVKEKISPLALLKMHPAFASLCCVGFLDSLAVSALPVFLPLLLLAKGIPTGALAVLVSLFFAASLLGKVVMGNLADRCGRSLSLAIIQGTMALALLGLCLADHVMMLALAVIVVGALSRGSLPIILALTAEKLPRETFEVGFGLNQAILGLATTLSPLILGLVAQQMGTTWAFAASAAFAGILASGILMRIVRSNFRDRSGRASVEA